MTTYPGWITEPWDDLFTAHPSFALDVLKRLSRLKAIRKRANRNPEPEKQLRLVVYNYSAMSEEQQTAAYDETMKQRVLAGNDSD